MRRMICINNHLDPRVHLVISMKRRGLQDIKNTKRVELKRYINSLLESFCSYLREKSFEVERNCGNDFSKVVTLITISLKSILAALLDRNPLQSFHWLSWATNDPRKNRIRYKICIKSLFYNARILPNDLEWWFLRKTHSSSLEVCNHQQSSCYFTRRDFKCTWL